MVGKMENIRIIMLCINRIFEYWRISACLEAIPSFITLNTSGWFAPCNPCKTMAIPAAKFTAVL